MRPTDTNIFFYARKEVTLKQTVSLILKIKADGADMMKDKVHCTMDRLHVLHRDRLMHSQSFPTKSKHVLCLRITQQNRVVERKHIHIIETVFSMMHIVGIPFSHWTEVFILQCTL